MILFLFETDLVLVQLVPGVSAIKRDKCIRIAGKNMTIQAFKLTPDRADLVRCPSCSSIDVIVIAWFPLLRPLVLTVVSIVDYERVPIRVQDLRIQAPNPTAHWT